METLDFILKSGISDGTKIGQLVDKYHTDVGALEREVKELRRQIHPDDHFFTVKLSAIDLDMVAEKEIKNYPDILLGYLERKFNKKD